MKNPNEENIVWIFSYLADKRRINKCMEIAVEKILPLRLKEALSKLDKGRIYEIRLRPTGVSINYGGRFFGLSDVGLCAEGMKISCVEIEEVILKASGHSIYAVNNQIKNGFLSLGSGVRIGICGEVNEKTIKNFTSVNIRFPHEIKGCADGIIKYIRREKGCFNTLIVSSPGRGKTTLLRDIVRQVSDGGCNVLVADERYEIAAFHDGISLDVGRNTDVISGADKAFAFEQGIRYMRPDVLAADEIMSVEDLNAISRACKSGVNVIASIHADEEEYKDRLGETNFADRIVVLSDKGVGVIKGVYDGNYGKIA